MKLVQITNMIGYNPGHEIALADHLADITIASGQGILSPKHATSGLQPDTVPVGAAPAPAPRQANRFLTRPKRPGANR